MKVVLDTNVLIAAFAAHGLCHLVLEAVLAHHKMLLSSGVIDELQSNLIKKLKLPSQRAKEIGMFLKHQSIFMKDLPVAHLECRDKDDIKVLALAINGGAEAIVTGDKDLLVLKSIQGIPILDPRNFWILLKAG